MDRNRKKLEYGSKIQQIQTDQLHHQKKNVMTRNQISNLKNQVSKNDEAKKGRQKQVELQKEKLEKDKLERQKRLEKRGIIKERHIKGVTGKRKRG